VELTEKGSRRRFHQPDDKVDITCSGFYIKGSYTKTKDQNVAFVRDLVETVGDGGSCRLIDNTENVQAGNGSGVLGAFGNC